NTDHPSPPPAATDHRANTGVHPASTGSAISTIATTTTATGVAKGAEISTAASGGQSQAGQHGKAAEPHGNGADASGGNRGAHVAKGRAHIAGPPGHASG